MVSAQGFEPRTHALEGRCSIQLSYAPILFIWSGKRDSNSRLSPWQGDALPLNYSRKYNGGNNRTRTCDPLINSQLLYQHTRSRVYLIKLATWKGLEPSTSSVTGWHSNQLNYQAANGGTNRARTCDPLLVRQVLSQLSYSPISYFGAGEGDRTLTAGLEGRNSTIELHPHIQLVTHRGIEPLLPP